MSTRIVSQGLLAAMCVTGLSCGSREESLTLQIRDIEDIRSDVIVENDVAVIMRDGTRLSARVFRPSAPGRYPVIMALTAYDKDLGPSEYPEAAQYAELPGFEFGGFAVSEWTAWEAPDPATWVPLGYAVIYLDVRGYHDSAGDASLFGAQDGDDFYDAIEWAGAREWSNGNVGLMGVSYLAIAQWVAAGANPPSLKAIVPWEGQTDSLREVIYHGGVPETVFTGYWLARLNEQAHTPPLPPLELFRAAQPDLQVLRPFIPPAAIAFDSVTVPALICASWSDHGMHTRGSFEAFKQIRSEQRWLFTHGREKWRVYYSDDALAAQRQFLDHFLHERDNGMDEVPAVRIEVRETLTEYQVRYEDEWPIARTEYRELYLDSRSGTLAMTAPEGEAVAEYAPLEDSAVFTFTFDEDTELTGYMKLRLWVSTTAGEEMDLFVGVEKLDTRGRVVHFHAKAGYTRGPVALGWLRVSERALDEERSTRWQPWLSHDDPQPLTPGAIVPVEIEIWPSSTLFRAGETLRLVVQGRDLFEHVALGHHDSNRVNVGTHAIHTGGTYDSHLLVPVVR